MDKISMLRRAVFTSGMESTKAADLYERMIDVLEEQKIVYSLIGLGFGWFIGLLFGAFIASH